MAYHHALCNHDRFFERTKILPRNFSFEHSKSVSILFAKTNRKSFQYGFPRFFRSPAPAVYANPDHSFSAKNDLITSKIVIFLRNVTCYHLFIRQNLPNPTKNHSPSLELWFLLVFSLFLKTILPLAVRICRRQIPTWHFSKDYLPFLGTQYS